MRRSTRLSWCVAAILAMVVGGGSSAAEEPQSPQPPIPVAGTPIVVEGGVVAEVDMAEVPETPQLAKVGGIRTHIQGEFLQHQPIAAKRSPITEGERGEPTVELDLGNNPAAAPSAPSAPGSHVVAFEGAPASGWIPPDTVAAAGYQYIVEAVNSGFQIYTKAGTQVRGYTDFESFVNLPSPWDGFCYDPRVIYDTRSDRFLILILGLDTTNLKSYFWLLVPKTFDPNGEWWVIRFDATTGAPGAEEWLDFASLGADPWGVYVVGNSFGFAQGSGFQQSRLWTLSRALIDGGSSNGHVWNDLRWPNGNLAFSLQVALPLGGNLSNSTFLVNNYPASGTDVCLWELTGDRFPGHGKGTPTLSRAAINARTYYGIFNNVDQPGSPWDIDGGDCRIQNAVYAPPNVYTTFALDWDGSHSYSEAYVLALDTASNTKAWDHAIWNPDYYMFYPAIAVEAYDSDPNWMVAMSMTVPSDPNAFAGTIALTHDPATDTSSFWWDKLGLGPYSVWDGGSEGAGRNRWGDYSMAVYDWYCDNAWGAAEYATASNSWATRLFARTLDDEGPCLYGHIFSPNGNEMLTAGSSHTIQWELINATSPYEEVWLWLYTSSGRIDYGPFDLGETSFSWTVPNVDSPNTRLELRLWNSNGFWDQMDLSDFEFAIIGLPDLESAGLSTTAGAYAGQQILVDRSVINSGAVAVDGYQEELRLSSDATCTSDDRLIAGGTFEGLGVDELDSFAYHIILPVDLVAGDYSLCQMIDPGGLLTELDVTNNLTTAPFSVLTTDIFASGFEDGDFTGWSGWMP